MASVLPLILLITATFIVAAPVATAQSGFAPFKEVQLEVDVGSVDVPYVGQATVPFVVRDASRDSLATFGGPEGSGFVNRVHVDVEVEGRLPGWNARTTTPVAFLAGGDQFRGDIVIETMGNVQDVYANIWVNVSMPLPNGSEIRQVHLISARVEPFYRGTILVEEGAATAGQYEKVTFPVRVRNAGLYPDTFLLNVTAPDDYEVHVPPRVYIPPKETVYVNLTVKTPKGKLYEFGRPDSILVHMRSENGAATYTSSASVFVRGAYFDVGWLPLTALGLLAVGLIVQRGREITERRRLERGKPRRPRPTPRQAVLLKALKKGDPERYDAQRSRLARVWAARRAEYRKAQRTRRQEIRAAKKRVRAEMREEKRARKVERKAEKLREKEAAREERAARKVYRKKKRAILKDKKRLEKQRRKLARKKAKKDAKEEKRDAKRRLKQEKRDAKAEKRRARAEKRAARKQGKKGR